MWHLHSQAWNGDYTKQNCSVIQEHILLPLNSSQGVATAPTALRGRAATKHDFLGVRNQCGKDETLESSHCTGHAGQFQLQDFAAGFCGFGRKAVTLTLCFALHPHTFPPEGAFTFTLCKGNYPPTGIPSLKDINH